MGGNDTDQKTARPRLEPTPSGVPGYSAREARPRPEPRRAAPDPRQQQRADFLATASRLLASSLDYETTLATVAGLALPELGAWCIVDVVEADGSMRRLSVVHPDPEKQRLTAQLVESWPPERDDPIGAPVVMRTRRPEVVPQVTESLLVKVARGPENLAVLRQLGIGTVVVVPLLARDAVLGAMTFITPAAGRAYTPEDLALAEDLAARCAMAIDNARLYLEAQRARHEAESANRAKSQFMAMASHEFRTPINAVLGFAQLMEMGLAGPVTEEQRTHLERIHASSQHLLGLVNEVLDLAKVESGQMIVHHEPGNLAEAVRSACDIMHAHAVECELVIDRRCDPEAGAHYIGDPDRVRQILLNLIGNACKFTPPGGRIEVRCGVADPAPPEARLAGEGPWAYVCVEDTGIGISPEHQRRIFEPFVQASEGTTRSQDGSGLGLAIARRLAQLMGGDLTVRSAPGQGSEFTLWLPAGPGAAAATPREHRDLELPVEGAAELAAILFERGESILDTYVARLRNDEAIPEVGGVSDAALRSHVRGYLAEVGEMLLLARERGRAASEVLRDGSRIQQVIAQLHGTQRRKLGWTEDALRRDLRLLRQSIVEEVRRHRDREPAVEDAVELLERILDRGERTSRRAWRLAVPGG
jgi:signal transduction histidine kinase